MGKQQNDNDNLFENMNIGDLESSLIDVDIPETEALEEELGEGEGKEKGSPGSGEPGKGKKPGEKTDPPGRKTDNTLIVDRQPGDEEELGEDDDKGQAGKSKKEKDKKGGGTPNEGNESPVYLHAAALQEHGVLPNFDLKSLDGLKPPEAILKINEHIQGQIDESIKEGIEDYKTTLGEKARSFVESLESGIPFEDLADNYTLEERYANISTKKLEDNVELQEQVYFDLLALKGFSDEKIKKMVALAKEKEILLGEATDGLGEIQTTIEKERKQLKKNADDAKKERETKNDQVKAAIQKTISETKEIFSGIEITEAEKKDLVKMMTTPVNFVNKEGKKIPMSEAMALRAKNPIAYELRLNYLIKNGFFDEKPKKGAFDVFTKKVETSATRKLAEVLDKTEKRTTGKPASEVNKEEVDKNKTEFVFPQYQ
jgi:hypothetical protein